MDSYLLGDRLGVHFAVEVSDDIVHLDELGDSAWVDKVADLSRFSPRVPGIDTHLHYIIEQLDRLRVAVATGEPAASAARDLCWRPLAQFDLVEHRFLNR